MLSSIWSRGEDTPQSSTLRHMSLGDRLGMRSEAWRQEAPAAIQAPQTRAFHRDSPMGFASVTTSLLCPGTERDLDAAWAPPGDPPNKLPIGKQRVQSNNVAES